MKFCPKCEVRLKKNNSNSVLSCPKCGYAESGSKETKKNKQDEIKSEINILDENEGKETLPTIKIDCEKCGNDQAVWWMLQTRSADEPTTQFYRCIKCNHTWRNYA
ncbi:MAG: transcription factor S [Nitrosopumilaceae archaeon]|nr:MAG: Transcription factor S [Nitrosopumilales archaeon]